MLYIYNNLFFRRIYIYIKQSKIKKSKVGPWILFSSNHSFSLLPFNLMAQITVKTIFFFFGYNMFIYNECEKIYY